MIQIKSTPNRNLNLICDEHFNSLSAVVLSSLGHLKARQRDFITSNLRAILTGSPASLPIIWKDYKAHCTSKGRGAMSPKNVKSGLQKAFNYKRFTKTDAIYYCGYHLARKLNVKTCPYCNRNYTITIDTPKRKTRPDFDHFLPKAQYPLLALSFYNLVPSCLVCNRSIKNQATIVHDKFIHPYEEGFGTATKFSYIPLDTDSSLGLGERYRVNLLPNVLEPKKAERCRKSVELFKIKEIYEESHMGEISDIIRKHHISGGNYLSALHKSFPKLGTIEELFRVGFGNYYNEHDFEKRPLSKLTKDIVQQLVFIFPELGIKR